MTQSAKHGSEDLHLPKSHCQLRPGCIGINGHDRDPIRAKGNFHCLISFAYVQQVLYLREGTTQKVCFMVQILHKKLQGKQTS